MKRRWLVVLAVALILGVGVFGATERADPARVSTDAVDLLALSLHEGQSAELSVPSETSLVRIRSSVVIDTSQPHDPMARHPYALTVALVNAGGERVWEHRYELEGRVSFEPTGSRFAVRTAEPGEQPTDSRTLDVPLSGLTETAAKLVVTAHVGDAKRALVRASRVLRRPELATQLFERRLAPSGRAKLVGRRSSLGFADLPLAARETALSVYEERLSAAGRRGTDYQLERIVVTSWRSPVPLSHASEPLLVGRWRRALVNVDGDAEIGVLAPPQTRIVLREGAYLEAPRKLVDRSLGFDQVVSLDDSDDARRELTVPDSGRLHIALPGALARSVSIGADSAKDVPIFLLAKPGGALIGAPTRFATSSGDLALAPDVRRATYVALDPEAPVRFRVHPEQPVLRLSVREAFTGSDLVSQRAWSVRMLGEHGRSQRRSITAKLSRSRFDRTVAQPDRAALDVSDAAHFYLRTPDWVRHVEVSGSPSILLRASVPEPAVHESVAEAAYLVPRAPRSRWRYAPREVSRWASLRAEDHAGLEDAGRLLSVVFQARIQEARERHGTPLPERLLPVSGAAKRYLTSSVFVAPGAALPRGASVPLGSGVRVIVPSEGPGARRITASFEVGDDALGGTARLLVDGKQVARTPIVTLSGALSASVPEGEHHVEVTGLGASGRAVTDAAPASGGAVLRRKAIYRLQPGAPARVEFDAETRERYHLVLLVLSPAPDAAYRIRWSREGLAEPIVGEVTQRFTRDRGVLSGTTSDAEALGATGYGEMGVGRGVISIGGDHFAGSHRLTLELTSEAPVDVRAILVGKGGDVPVGDAPVHLWTEEAD